MRVGLAAVCALALLVGGKSVGQAAFQQGASTNIKNPVFNRDFPDPSVYRAGKHSYYAYGTSTGWDVRYFPILHSADLIHWKLAGDMLKTALLASIGGTDLWAPYVVKHRHAYVGYFTELINGTHCILASMASKAAGPFKVKGTVACSGPSGAGYIDPDLFIDSDGKAYLYVSVDSPQHTISVIPMKSDLLHPAGPAQELFGVSQRWEKGDVVATVEGPFMLHTRHAYFLFYSGNSTDTKGYAMGYATSSSPLGPFTKCSCNPIMHADAKVFGPGGGSVVKGPNGKYWMVYHAWTGTRPPGSGGIRSLRVDSLTWNGSTWSVHVTP